MKLDELQFKMLSYIGLPMPPECPSALRYDLAKYDSDAISETYDGLYKLSLEGRMFVLESGAPLVKPEVSSPVLVLADGRIVSHSSPELPEELFEAEKADIRIVSGGDPLTADDLPGLLKELDKLTREYLKRGSGSVFAPIDGDEPGKPLGVGFFGEKDMNVSAALFAKRAETILALGAEG